MKLLRQECFAAMADDALRERSSSGGAFGLLARRVLERGGVVCGAAFDGNMNVRHVIVRDESGLEALRGSKYARSIVPAELLAEVGRILDEGRLVAFFGLPCQVDAVKRRFERYGGLFLTADMICGGAPEHKYFTAYLNENWGVGNVKKFEFRSKARGWRAHHYLLHVVLKDGREEWRERTDDEFMPAMAMSLTKPDACFSCRYCNMDRPGDLTIADFWGVPAEMDDGKGTSLVLANTEAGRQWFGSVIADFKKVKQYPPELAQAKQGRLRCPVPPHPALGMFREMTAAGKTIREALDACTRSTDRNVGILNFHWETVNFGAVLTAYALNRTIRSLGWNAVNINFRSDLPRVLKKPENPLFDAFRRRHIPQTHPVSNGGELDRLNRTFGTFVVGSDQVWNPKIGGWYRDVYFLTFAAPGKRLVSAAASFGCDAKRVYGKGFLRKLLRPFSAVSVREKPSMVDLEASGVRSSVICDPVFMLDGAEWRKLAGARPDWMKEGDAVWYCVNQSEMGKVSGFLDGNAKLFEGRLHRLDMRIGIEEWLAAVSSASLVVTDSFHGMCFALIFNRPFVVFASDGPKTERMRGLLAMAGVEGRLFTSAEDAPDAAALMRPPCPPGAEEALRSLREDSIAWLREALDRPAAADRRAVAAMRSRNRALAVRELWRIFLVIGFTGLVIAKATAKLLLCRSVAREVAEIAKRDGELAGRKRAVVRLLGQLKRLYARPDGGRPG